LVEFGGDGAIFEFMLDRPGSWLQRRERLRHAVIGGRGAVERTGGRAVPEPLRPDPLLAAARRD
jgi:hypothetical protein